MSIGQRNRGRCDNVHVQDRVGTNPSGMGAYYSPAFLVSYWSQGPEEDNNM